MFCPSPVVYDMFDVTVFAGRDVMREPLEPHPDFPAALSLMLRSGSTSFDRAAGPTGAPHPFGPAQSTDEGVGK
jgi:hypothetical protein